MKLKYSINLLLFLALSFFAPFSFGQPNEAETASVQTEKTQTNANPPAIVKPTVPTTNILHQNGRINLVVFVLATIFAGIILYLVRIERTLSKIEKK